IIRSVRHQNKSRRSAQLSCRAYENGVQCMFRILVKLSFVFCLNVGISPLFAVDEQYGVSLTVPEDPNGNTDIISDLTFSGDGQMLAVAYGKFTGLLQEPHPGQTIVWDIKSGRRLTTLRSYLDGVSSVDFSKDGKLLATGSYDGTVQLWSSSNWRRQTRIKATQGTVTSLHFCPQTSTLAVGTWQDKEGSLKNTINLYQASTGRQIANLEGHTEEGIMSVQYSPDCREIVSSAMDGSVRIWNVISGTNRVIYQTDTAWFYSVAFSSDGQLMAAVGGDLPTRKWHIRVWDAKTWKLNLELNGEGRPLNSVTVSHDNQWLAAASRDGDVKLWNLVEKQSIKLSQPASRTALSPDGKVIALAHGRVVRLFRIEQFVEKAKGN
ncbi:MAG TPA: hypothetical protein VMM56_05160, partial [Planctomycetaceae bacterium]|nr:hypothetical protein [Planctomycetaceae bacterium]